MQEQRLGTARALLAAQASNNNQKTSPKGADRFDKMRQLDVMAWRENNRDSKLARQYATEALKLHRSIRAAETMHRSMTVLARQNCSQHDFRAALELLAPAISAARSSGDFLCLELAYRVAAEVNVRLRNFSEALRYIELCRAIIRKHGLSMLNVDLLHANVLAYQNKIVAAIELCEKVLSQAEAEGETSSAAVAATHLSALYRIVGDFSKVGIIGKRATELNLANGFLKNQIAVYMSLAEGATHRQDFDLAVSMYDKAWELAVEYGVDSDRAIVLLNRASMLTVRMDLDGAQHVLNRVRQIAANLGDNSHAAIAMIQGKISLERLEYPEACKHYQAALNAKHSVPAFDLWTIHLGLATSYEKLNRAEDALRHHKLYVQQFERVQGVGVQQRINLIERRFERKRVQHAKELMQCQISELNAEVSAANAELAKLALSTAQRTIGLQQLHDNISRELNRTPAAAKSFLEKLRSSVDGLMTAHESWQPFNDQFNKVHLGFTQRLAQKHPNLSPTEMHICALMLVGLRSKDIAEILHVSRHTVNTHRQNIRRKMQLTRASNLGNHLSGI